MGELQSDISNTNPRLEGSPELTQKARFSVYRKSILKALHPDKQTIPYESYDEDAASKMNQLVGKIYSVVSESAFNPNLLSRYRMIAKLLETLEDDISHPTLLYTINLILAGGSVRLLQEGSPSVSNCEPRNKESKVTASNPEIFYSTTKLITYELNMLVERFSHYYIIENNLKPVKHILENKLNTNGWIDPRLENVFSSVSAKLLDNLKSIRNADYPSFPTLQLTQDITAEFLEIITGEDSSVLESLSEHQEGIIRSLTIASKSRWGSFSYYKPKATSDNSTATDDYGYTQRENAAAESQNAKKV